MFGAIAAGATYLVGMAIGVMQVTRTTAEAHDLAPSTR